MKWSTPRIVEIAVGLEINAYACAGGPKGRQPRRGTSTSRARADSGFRERRGVAPNPSGS